MAEQTQTAIFELKLDYGATLKKLEDTEKEIQKLKEGQKEYNKQAKEGSFSSEEMARKTLEYRNALKELQAEQRAEQRMLDLYIKQTQEAAGSNNQLRAQLSFLTVQYNAMSEAERETTEDGRRMGEEIKRLSDVLKENEKAVGDNRRNVGNYSEAVQEGVEQIKEYQNSISGLQEKLTDLNNKLKTLDVDSQEFQDTKDAADDTSESILRLTGKIDEFGNREPKSKTKQEMDAISDATVGAVSAFEVYNLTMGDSEEQSAAQERALRAIAVAQNLRNIQIGIANAGEAASVIVTKASTFATTAQTKATTIATGVQRVFNTVLKANPIGVVITAVAALAAIVVFLTDKFGIATKAMDFMNEKFSGFMKIVQSVGESLGLLDSANDKAIANFGRLTEGVEANIQVLEAQGGKEREIYALRVKLANDELTLLRRKMAEKGELDAEELKRFRELKTSLEVMRLEEKARLEKAAEDDKKEADRQQKDRTKEQEDRVKAAQEANLKLLQDRKALIEAQLAYAKEGSKQELSLRERLVRAQLAIENSGADTTAAQRKRNEALANAEVLKLRKDFLSGIANLTTEDQKAEIQRRLNGTRELSEANLKAQLDLIALERDTLLKNEKLTQNQRKLIIEDAQRAIIQKTSDHIQALLDLERKRIEDFKALQKKEYDESVNNTDDFYKTRTLALTQQLEQGLISQQQFDDLSERQNLERLENQLRNTVDHQQNTTEIETQLSQSRIQIRKNELAEKQRLQDEEFQMASLGIDALSSLTTIIGGKSEEAAEFQKQLAIFQLGIDSVRSISQIVTLATAPTADNLLTGGLTVPLKIAALTATVLANIAQAREMLNEETPKAPKGKYGITMGQLLQGPSHEYGGLSVINPRTRRKVAELEGNEAVLTSGVTKDPVLFAMASALNVLGGGVPLAPTNYGALGGIMLAPSEREMTTREVLQPMVVQQTSPLSIDYKQLAGAMKGITIVTDVRDVTQKQQGIVYTQNRASAR